MRKRLILSLIAFVLCFASLSPFSARALTEEEIEAQIQQKDNEMKALKSSIEKLNEELDEAEEKSKQLKSDINKLKNDIEALNKLIEPAEEKIAELSGKIAGLEGKISEYNVTKAELEEQISDCENAINNAEDIYDNKREMLKSIMRASYENGMFEPAFGLSVMLDSDSLSSYLIKMEAMDKVTAATKESMDDYMKAINDKTAYKETLEASKNELNEVLTSLEADTKEYNDNLTVLEAEKKLLDENKADLVKNQNNLSKKLKDSEDLEDEISAKIKTQNNQLKKFQEEMKRLEEELENIQSVAQGGSEKNFIWPLIKKFYITSYYDDDEYYKDFGTRHYALDIGGTRSNPIQDADVLATKSGTVSKSTYQAGGAGNYVIIDHGNGELSHYYHLETRSVKAGEKVKQGQKIGTVGSTGNSTGPHLHFAIKINNKWVDPEPLTKTSRSRL